MPVASQPVLDRWGDRRDDAPPPVVFRAEVPPGPEVPFAPAIRQPAVPGSWRQVRSTVSVLALLTVVALIFLLLGYGFAKAFLGA